MSRYSKVKESGETQELYEVDDGDGVEETLEHLRRVFGGRWVLTPEGIGGAGCHYSWDKKLFYPPKPFPSWYPGDDGEWQPPRPFPPSINSEGVMEHHYWDEASCNWIIGQIEDEDI
jgi:hypothetical protein